MLNTHTIKYNSKNKSMPFLNYNNNCFSPLIEQYEEIGAHFNIEIDDEQVWELARESEEIPLIENIYQSLLLSRICSELEEQHNLKTDCFINGMDTHLYFLGQNDNWDKICFLDDVLSVLNLEAA